MPSSRGCHRLVRYDQLVDAWRRASRAVSARRPVRAGALLERAARAARALSRWALLDRVPPAPPVTPHLDVGPRHAPVPVSLQLNRDSIPMSRRVAEGLARVLPVQLWIDLPRQRVLLDGTELSLVGQAVLLQMLAALVRAGDQSLTLEELFTRVWKRPMIPEYDANTVYSHLSRLRKLLERAAPGRPIVLTTPYGYRLAPGLTCALIDGARPALSAAPGAVLRIVRDRQVVDNRAYCRLRNVSRSTAIRELNDLVRSGLLVREGAGRGVRYRVARTDGSGGLPPESLD